MALELAQTKVPGLLRRLAAMLYDLVLLLAILLVAETLVVVPYIELVGPDFPHGSWWHRLYLLAVGGLFYGYFWVRGGQTLGMRAWRLRVLREDGGPLRPSDALRRLLWAGLCLAPLGLGLLWMLIDRDGLTLYDRLSHTRPAMTKRGH